MSKRSSKKKKSKTPSKDETVSRITATRLWDRYPDWVAIGIIILLLFIFFNPIIFGQKTLLPPDSVASKGLQKFKTEAIEQGTFPLWNPYIFSGMPSFASLSTIPLYFNPINWLLSKSLWLVSFGQIGDRSSVIVLVANYILLGGMVYLLLRSKKISPGAALFSGLAMVFMPQAIAYAAFSHPWKLGVAVFIPLLFLLVDKLLERRNLLFFSLTGLGVGLQLLRLHVQICFYTQLMIGIYLVYWVVGEIRKKTRWYRILKGVGLVIGAVLMGLLVASILYLSIWEYSHYSIRGGGETGGLDYGYATGWSFPPSEITTFLIPSFMGFGRETYWGPMPFTDLPLYFGLITLLLGGFALLLNRNKTTVFFAILAVTALLISFGRHLPVLYGPMFKLMPFFNKFRAPKMIHILFEFCMVILAAYGLQALLDFQEDKKGLKLRRIRRYLTGFGVVLGLLFVFLLVGKGVYLGWASKLQSPEAAYDKALQDGLKAVVIFGCSAVLILLTARARLNRRWLPFLLSGMLMLDFWLVNRRFVEPMPMTNRDALYSETEDIATLKETEGFFRILPESDSRSPNGYMIHGIQSVQGYHGAKLRNYQDLLSAFGFDNRPSDFLRKYLKIEDGQFRWKRFDEVEQPILEAHRAFLRMMNVRFVVTPYPLSDLDPAFRLISAPRTRSGSAVFEFAGFLPRVFFPEEVLPVEGKEAILGYLSSGDFDPGRTAVVEERIPFEFRYDQDNRANIVEYEIHRIVIQAEIASPALMVLSEVYYPAGWKAYVDGRETRIYKTDYVLRSIALDPGVHRIEFVFEPKMVSLGKGLGFSAFFLLAVGAVIGFLSDKKRRT